MAKAASSPARAEPGLAKKLSRKKNKKRYFWKGKAQEASTKPESDPRLVVLPPKAPQDFSQNWKALQRLLEQRPKTAEKPLGPFQVNPKGQPRITPPNRRTAPAEDGAPEKPRPARSTGRKASGGSEPTGPVRVKKVPAPFAQATGAGHDKEGTLKRTRTNGAVSPLQEGSKQKRQKAGAGAPAPPTEEDIWFDDVDPEDIEAAVGPEAADIVRKRLGQHGSGVSLEKDQGFSGLTRALALDCEMVGVGPTGEESVAARVSLVNQHGKCVYDKYIRPKEPVTDYRTAVSGIRPQDLQQGEELTVVQREVAGLLEGRLLVGHALHNDLKVLFLDHPRKKIRDTQKYKPFKLQVKSGQPSLKLLSEKILGLRVQRSEHCSIQDAQAAMRLYILARKEWESVAKGKQRTPSARPNTHAGHKAC
ncbi:RNA exonuclease 4 [Tenrec ecaudatus]|uniref:RNA exonuclease 4 n=1 Tax=Tenrec ecaudatus TaxID=94439 RepID=UPI003F5ABC8F